VIGRVAITDSGRARYDVDENDVLTSRTLRDLYDNHDWQERRFTFDEEGDVTSSETCADRDDFPAPLCGDTFTFDIFALGRGDRPQVPAARSDAWRPLPFGFVSKSSQLSGF